MSDEKQKTKEKRTAQQGPLLLKVNPTVLQYEPPYNRIIANIVTLKNLTNNLVAFKVKTTAPKRYVVRPNIGFIEPLAAIEVQVQLMALPEAETPPKEKDRFQIQSIDLSTIPPTQTDYKDVWKTVQDSQVSKHRLKVRFGATTTSSSSSAASSSMLTSALTTPSSLDVQAQPRHVVTKPEEKLESKAKESETAPSLDELQSQLKKVIAEKEKLSKENEHLVLQNRKLQSQVAGTGFIDAKLIVLAIICLLLGYYLRGA
eukprot:TRINITY_DN8773_c0_g1_i1.p1 TRINITY_DN8773_c0_g1~~TRINITY_DN8773_c0_g1_i1.p1  ORF type:complete len:259 (-),score=67.34 TRINITY_DN8773_c0_g1_i1:109-885(-)